MDERGRIYAAPEDQIPDLDKKRLERHERLLAEKIQSGEEVFAQLQRLQDIRADLIAQRYTDT